MSYSDYTIDALVTLKDLILIQKSLFQKTPKVESRPWLADSLDRGKLFASFSEKARGEFIVAPMLLGCQEIVAPNCSIYSGVTLDVDSEQGLRGDCDFILGSMPPYPILRAPLCVLLEAKRGNIEDGLGQCAAQMYAARLFNERHNRQVYSIYGCVTTGDIWQFLRLQDETLYADSDRYYISDVDKILGILVAVMTDSVA